MSLINARLLDTNLSSYESFYSDQSRSENLTASEFKALQHLSKNKNILIHKVDKSNTIVILDKISYISAIEEILNDHKKFSDLDIPAGKEINYITNFQKTITSDLKLLKDEEIIDKAIIRTLNWLGLDQLFCTGYEKCTRKPILDYHLSIQFFQLLVCLPTTN